MHLTGAIYSMPNACFFFFFSSIFIYFFHKYEGVELAGHRLGKCMFSLMRSSKSFPTVLSSHPCLFFFSVLLSAACCQQDCCLHGFLYFEGWAWILITLGYRYHWSWCAFAGAKVNQKYLFKLTYFKTIFLLVWSPRFYFLAYLFH